MFHMGKDIAKGNCVTHVGGLLIGFQHASPGCCLSLIEQEGVYEFARLFHCS